MNYEMEWRKGKEGTYLRMVVGWILHVSLNIRWILDFTGYAEGLLYRVNMLRLGLILDETLYVRFNKLCWRLEFTRYDVG